MNSRPPNGHLGDALSGLLDGELTPVEQVAAEAHLASCPQCRAELEAVGAVRSWTRALPAVHPPFGFYERMLLPPRRRRGLVAALGGAAAAAVLAGGLIRPAQPTVAPRVARLVTDHASTASAGQDPITPLIPVAVPVSFGR